MDNLNSWIFLLMFVYALKNILGFVSARLLHHLEKSRVIIWDLCLLCVMKQGDIPANTVWSAAGKVAVASS